jgi:acyl-CoA thioesterase
MVEVLERVGDLDRVLTFKPDNEGGLLAAIPESLSNAPQMMPESKGAPFGGLMAALAVKAARESLGVEQPLRTLTVQYLSGAKFEDVCFTAESLTRGRSTHFAEVRANQGRRTALVAGLTFGADGPGPRLRPIEQVVPAKPLDAIESVDLNPGFAPWFTRWVEYRFAEDFKGFGNHREPVVRVWLRLKDGKPLDELRLAFLLDAVFPNYFMVTAASISTTVDLRYDLFHTLTPQTSPDGWAYFEFNSHDVSDGWALEDGVALAPDGTPIAAARQLRKMISRADARFAHPRPPS